MSILYLHELEICHEMLLHFVRHFIDVKTLVKHLEVDVQKTNFLMSKMLSPY